MWSHALRHAACGQGFGAAAGQFGVQAMCLDEAEARKEHGIPHSMIHGIHCPRKRPSILLPGFSPPGVSDLRRGWPRPSIMPDGNAVLTAGSWYPVARYCGTDAVRTGYLGFDVVELAPVPGMHASISPPPVFYASWGS